MAVSSVSLYKIKYFQDILLEAGKLRKGKCYKDIRKAWRRIRKSWYSTKTATQLKSMTYRIVSSTLRGDWSDCQPIKPMNYLYISYDSADMHQ